MSLEEMFTVDIEPDTLAGMIELAEKHLSNIPAGDDEPGWHKHLVSAEMTCGPYFDSDDPAASVVSDYLYRAETAFEDVATLSGCSRKDLQALLAHDALHRHSDRSEEIRKGINAVVKCPYCAADESA